jgi:hypothetical protein
MRTGTDGVLAPILPAAICYQHARVRASCPSRLRHGWTGISNSDTGPAGDGGVLFSKSASLGGSARQQRRCEAYGMTPKSGCRSSGKIMLEAV